MVDTIYPIINNKSIYMQKADEQEGAFWFPNEIKFEKDIQGFNKLNEDEKHFILTVIAFFANSDGVISENLALNFYDAFNNPEIKYYYSVQEHIEAIHNRVYSNNIRAYIPDEETQNKYFNAIEHFPSIKLKHKWFKKWMDKSVPLSHRIVGFICAEGISFASSFCAIYYLKSIGKELHSLYDANEFISRDEVLHAEFGCTILDNEFPEKPPQEVVHSIVSECVEVERVFCMEALPVSLLGMSSEAMLEYVKFIADYYLDRMGYDKLYNTKNPFPFMDKLWSAKKTDFFTAEESSYQRVTGGVNYDAF